MVGRGAYLLGAFKVDIYSIMLASLYAAECTSIVASVIPVFGLSFVKLSYRAIKITT